MAYKRPLKSSGSSKTSHSSKRHTATAKSSRASSNETSSSGFETPPHQPAPPRSHKAKHYFSNLSSVPHTEAEPSSPPLPLPSQQRFSLHTSRTAGCGIDSSDPHIDGPIEEEETDTEIKRREDADSMNEIIMAVDMKERGTLGCTYYIAREEKLCLMEDVRIAGLDIVDMLKLHVQPTVLLISSRADEELEDYLSKEARPIDRGEDDNSIFGLYVLNSRPSAEFNFEAAKNKIINLDLPSEYGAQIVFSTPGDDAIGNNAFGHDNVDSGVGRHGKLMRLGGWIDLDSHLTVGCAGAILSYLQRRKGVQYLPGDEAALIAFRVKKIEMFTLSDIMFINADTLVSLQILQSESHPNSHMQGPNTHGAKESLSIYGLFHPLAHTPQGKYKLRQLFLRPSMDLAVIEERQNTLSILLRPENTPALEKIISSLKRIKNIRTVVIHLQKGVSQSSFRGSSIQRGVWASLQQFTFHALKIVEAICELTDGKDLMIVIKCLEILQPFVLKQIGQWITTTVDFPRSCEQHRAAVMQGVDEELDNMKRTYDGLGDLLSQIATQLASEIPEYAQKYIENCIFFPQLGFLTVVPLDPETGKGKYEGEGSSDDIWEIRFCTEDMAYYKNKRMQETDEYFGDMYGMICDKEIEVIHALTLKVLGHEEVLISASDVCGELDSLVALAQGARRHNLVPALMTTANIICIKGGRHPLQELTVPSYVANDTFLQGGAGTKDQEDMPSDNAMQQQHSETFTQNVEGPSLLIMTGPNYSGKSVYLKQIALIVYMAHIGSFVPAESATIGLTDKILTRIATRESISRSQSAFMIDLQQVALAMTLATRRSIVIIDEFGKGTNSSDGAGLACGVFEYFLNLGPERPKVLGATHFHEIFENGYMTQRAELAFGHMEVRVNSSAELPEDQITYLYNFVTGRSTSSFGTYCAAMSGIDPAIIERAEQLILLSIRGNDLVAACSLLSDEETKDLQDAELVARRFLELDLPLPNGARIGSLDVRKMVQDVLVVASESTSMLSL